MMQATLFDLLDGGATNAAEAPELLSGRDWLRSLPQRGDGPTIYPVGRVHVARVRSLIAHG